VLARALQLAADLMFPPKCIGCQRLGIRLCLACRADLPWMPDGVCQRCAGRRGARGVCQGCRRLSRALTNIRAAFVYEGAARTAVLTLKFKSGRYLAPLMGDFLRTTLAARPLEADVVVPVPLAPARMRQRGFNQATLLAEQIAPLVDAPVVANALEREGRPAQQTLGAAERLINLRGSFTCRRPDEIEGRRVLLIDDVVTTGATLSACADTLAAVGARRVGALAFARDL
jgi:ComF family protein